MNAVEIRITIAPAGNQSLVIKMERGGHGDDLVEAHVAYFQHVLNGALLGLQAVKGKGEDDSGEEWKKG